MKQNGTATVCNDEGEGLFTAAMPTLNGCVAKEVPSFSAGRLGFNKTNPLSSR